MRWESLRTKTNLASSKLSGTELGLRPCWEVGTGTCERIWSRRRVSWRLSECRLRLGMKSPGTVRGAPYTISAGEHPRSSFGVVRSPKRTRRGHHPRSPGVVTRRGHHPRSRRGHHCRRTYLSLFTIYDKIKNLLYHTWHVTKNIHHKTWHHALLIHIGSELSVFRYKTELRLSRC